MEFRFLFNIQQQQYVLIDFIYLYIYRLKHFENEFVLNYFRSFCSIDRKKNIFILDQLNSFIELF